MSFGVLIDDGFAVAIFEFSDLHEQVAAFGEADAVGTVESQTDVLRMRAGRNDPVVFERAFIAVIQQIDAGIDAGVSDAGIIRNARAPPAGIFANKVVAF